MHTIIHMHQHTHTQTHISTCTYTSTQWHMHQHIHIHLYPHTWAHVPAHTCTLTYKHTQTHVCAHICTQTEKYTFFDQLPTYLTVSLHTQEWSTGIQVLAKLSWRQKAIRTGATVLCLISVSSRSPRGTNTCNNLHSHTHAPLTYMLHSHTCYTHTHSQLLHAEK